MWYERLHKSVVDSFLTAFQQRVPMQVEIIFGRVNEVVGMPISKLMLSVIAIDEARK